MILAGDIGGTHTRLAFFDSVDGRFSLVSASIFPSREYSGLDEIVTKFVDTSNLHPDTACFGIAGPVRNGRVEASNLPWIIESKRLADELKIKKAFLINDLEANAWGIPALDAKDVVALNHVNGQPVGNQAVIAAGTGLGEAGMYWDGAKHQVFACEGGHADFAPRTQLEVELFNYLQIRFGHVSYERIVSGPGLVNVFSFLRDTGRGTPPQWLADEMSHSDPAGRDLTRRHRQQMRAMRTGARPVRLYLRRRGGQSGAQDHGHGRNLSGRRNSSQNAVQTLRAAVHAGFYRQGPDAGFAGSHASPGDHQRPHRADWRCALCSG
jgi:glucokinase